MRPPTRAPLRRHRQSTGRPRRAACALVRPRTARRVRANAEPPHGAATLRRRDLARRSGGALSPRRLWRQAHPSRTESPTQRVPRSLHALPPAALRHTRARRRPGEVVRARRDLRHGPQERG